MTERSDTIGRFLVRGELGRGGAGRVVLARDPELDRDVAIKLLLPGDPVDWVQRVEAFRREGRIGSTLDHPAIAPIHEFGRTDEGDPFLVMRRVDGVSLREALGARGDSGARFSQARLLAAFAVACQAVGFAHRRGVVHRDLKPENVMLGQHGEVYVVDWGLAGGATRRAGPAQDPAATQDGTVIGTLGYLAPEAAFGVVSEVGPHSDVFSLGAILYEVLSGRRAICGDDLWRASLDPRIVPLPEVVPDLDEELAAVCAKALAREPRDRWSDAQELADALAAWQDGANRRTRADARVAEGRAALAAWTAGRGALQAADQRIRELEAAAAPWLPFDHPDKVAARDAISARTEAQVELAGRFAAVEAAGEGALVLDPAHAGARALLADACLQRLLEAERAGSAADAAYLRTRLVAWDDGTRSARLRAGGAVSLVTDPPGARVTARRYDQRPTVWALGDPVDLGHTPLDRVALAAGSWVLELESPGRRTTRYPVRIERDGHWDVHAERPLPLFTEAEIGEGWIYVPEGPYLSGGDPDVSFPRPLTEVWVDGFFVRRFAVTAAEYAGWLHQLKKAGEDWEARAPRIPDGGGGAGGRMWRGEPPFAFPLTDIHGDGWPPDWAVCGISWFDAAAFAQGAGARLLTEDEFEKAARGVDARRYPWGTTFDPALCKMALTRPGTPVPEPVGCVPADRSPFEVGDLAGVMRTFCARPNPNEDSVAHVRGGYWGAGERLCRSANRYPSQMRAVQAHLGVRLARNGTITN